MYYIIVYPKYNVYKHKVLKKRPFLITLLLISTHSQLFLHFCLAITRHWSYSRISRLGTRATFIFCKRFRWIIRKSISAVEFDVAKSWTILKIFNQFRNYFSNRETARQEKIIGTINRRSCIWQIYKACRRQKCLELDIQTQKKLNAYCGSLNGLENSNTETLHVEIRK